MKIKYCTSINKKLSAVIATIFLLFAFNLSAQQDTWQINHFIKTQQHFHPVSTLQDYYKSMFQDNFGTEHLIEDTLSVYSYLNKELKALPEDYSPLYEFCGLEGNFVRVYLRCVAENIISDTLLARCFIESANRKSEITVEQWHKKWSNTVNYISSLDLNLKNFQNDSLTVEKILSNNQYAWVHSSDYRNTYKPHYRIVAEDLFYREIYPKIRQYLYSETK